MKNHWLERAEAKAMTMEQKIEKMLAPHHVIWLGDDTVGADAPHKMTPIPDQIFIDAGSIPSQVTVTWSEPQMFEWDFNATMYVTMETAGSVNNSSQVFPPWNTESYINAEIKTELETAVEAEFARRVEDEGWNLDL